QSMFLRTGATRTLYRPAPADSARRGGWGSHAGGGGFAVGASLPGAAGDGPGAAAGGCLTRPETRVRSLPYSSSVISPRSYMARKSVNSSALFAVRVAFL